MKPCPIIPNGSISLTNIDSLYNDTNVFTSFSSGNEHNNIVIGTANNNDDADTNVENRDISSFRL